MKSIQGIRSYILLAALFAAAGCAAPPEENAMLEQARAAYNAARTEPLVVRKATLELAKARENLLTAQQLWEERANKGEVEYYAYLARQQTAIARETAQLQSAQQAVEEAEAEVDANLALSKARSATAQEAVAALQKTIRSLQEEVERIQAQ